MAGKVSYLENSEVGNQSDVRVRSPQPPQLSN
jgi:hypothetical protein